MTHHDQEAEHARLTAENRDLAAELAASEIGRVQAESLLRAIQEGEVDGLVTSEGLTHLIPDTAKLATENRMVHGIVDAIAVAVIVIDETGIIRHWNPAAQRIFGYKVEDAVGQNVSCLMPKSTASEHDDFLRHYLETGEGRVIGQVREVTARRESGEEFPAQLRVNEMEVGGKRLFVGSVADVSSRIRTERKLDEKSQTIQSYIQQSQAASDNIERNKRQVFFRTLTTLIIMGVILAAATILPLYQDLRAKNDEELHFIIDARAVSIDQFLSRVRNIAEQIASRTEARRQLILFNEEQIDLTGLVKASWMILQDALENSEEVIGITRLDHTGMPVMALGTAVPEETLDGIDHELGKTTIFDPAIVDGKPLIAVAAPILDHTRGKVGTDVILFRTEALSSILQNDAGMGDTGEVILAHRSEGGFYSAFSTRNEAGLGDLTSVLEDFKIGHFGIEQNRHAACPACVVAVRSLSHPDWYLVFQMQESELNAIIDVSIRRILVVVGLILIIGMIGIYFLTYPLLRSLSQGLKNRIRTEAALQQKEAMFRSLFESAGDGILLVDPVSKTFVAANQVAYSRLGYSEEELLGMGPDDLAAPKSFVTPDEIFQIMQERESYTFEHIHRKKSGEYMPVEITVSNVDWSGRRVIQSVVRDISARKQAEERLRHNEALLAEAQRIASLGSWEWDIVAGTLDWSDEVYRIFGLPPQQFDATYDAFLEVVHPDDRDKLTAAVKQSLEDPKAFYSIEHRVRRPDGTERTVHERGEVHCGDDGTPIKMIGTVQDITARIEAESRLRDSEVWFRSIVENDAIGVYVTGLGPSGTPHLEYVSPRFAKIFGGDLLTFIGLVPMDLAHPDDRAMVEEKIRDGLTGNSERLHYRFRAFRLDNGQQIVVEIAAGRAEMDGRPVSISVVIDITKRVRAEERVREAAKERAAAEAASAAKSEFLSTVSHELRTPLTTVLGNMPPLLEDLHDIQSAQHESDWDLMPDTADTTAMVREIETEGQHLLDLINDTLDIAKIEAGQLTLELTDLDLREVVESACSTLSGRAAHLGLMLEYDLPETEVTVSADQRRLRQILINLVGNAIKFTDKGGIRVLLTADAGYAVCAVQDTGCGISKDDLSEVFKKFQQVGAKKEGGTGLGLAITKQLVELHDGKLSAMSTLGDGSTFTFSIPLKERKEQT